MRVSCTGRYSAGSRANRAVGRGRRRRGGRRRVLGGLLQHRGDLGDVDDVEIQRPLAGGVDRAGPVAADQPEQPVDLPHLRPRQVGVQQPLRIDADGIAVPAGRAGQRGDIAHRVGGLLRGQVRGVGDPPAGLLAGVGLDQLPAVEQLDQRRVGAGVQVGAQVLLRRRIQRPADLDVEVAVDLHPGEHRHVIGQRERQQRGRLVLGEHLRRAGLDGAVDPHPGRLAAPRLRAGLRIGQAGEGLAGEEVPAHVLHGPLHPRLVLRRADPGGVGGEPAVLGVIQPARGEPRVHRVGVRDDRRGVVGDQDLEHPAEEHPRRLAPGDERGQRLGEGQPHEHVPRIAPR